MNLGRLGIIIPRRFFNYASSTAGLRALAEDMAVFGPPPPPGSYQTAGGRTIVSPDAEAQANFCQANPDACLTGTMTSAAPPLTGAPIFGLNPAGAASAAASPGPMGIPVVGWLAIVGAVALMAFSGGSTTK